MPYRLELAPERRPANGIFRPHDFRMQFGDAGDRFETGRFDLAARIAMDGGSRQAGLFGDAAVVEPGLMQGVNHALERVGAHGGKIQPRTQKGKIGLQWGQVAPRRAKERGSGQGPRHAKAASFGR